MKLFINPKYTKPEDIKLFQCEFSLVQGSFNQRGFIFTTNRDDDT